MGYACPVCDEPQADAEHLANHLAITASLGREDHLEWLEEYAPDWADCGPEELGSIVAEYALEIDLETPDGGEFESGRGHGHAHGDGSGQGRPAVDVEAALARQSRQPGRGSLGGETERVLADARELTREMYDRRERDAIGGRDERPSRAESDARKSSDRGASDSGTRGGVESDENE